MSKKKNETKLTLDGLTITKSQLHYMHNGWACGYGKHGKDKYCRKVKHRDRDRESW